MRFSIAVKSPEGTSKSIWVILFSFSLIWRVRPWSNKPWFQGSGERREVVMKFARIYYWILSSIAVKKPLNGGLNKPKLMWQTLLSYHLGMIFTIHLWNYWGSCSGFTRLIYKLGISNRQWWRVSSRTHSNSTSDMLECVCYTCA